MSPAELDAVTWHLGRALTNARRHRFGQAHTRYQTPSGRWVKGGHWPDTKYCPKCWRTLRRVALAYALAEASLRLQRREVKRQAFQHIYTPGAEVPEWMLEALGHIPRGTV